MVFRISRILCLNIVFLAMSASTSLAQPAAAPNSSAASSAPSGGANGEEKDAKQPEESVKKGVIASFGRHREATAVDTATTPAQGDEQSAISGSVSRNKNNCVAKITNNGKNSYSVSFAVKGTNPRGTQTFRRSYSASLKPSEEVSREMNCQKDDNIEIEILTSRKTSR